MAETMTPRAKPKHPAPWPRYILDVITLYVQAEARALGRPVEVVDVFAGIGRIHDLPKRIARTTGVEIESEWGGQRAGTIIGDATALPPEWAGRFDAVITSPCFANRLADCHEAKDACFECKGTGAAWTAEGCADAPMFCPKCGVECVCGSHAQALRRHVKACRTCRGAMCAACGGNGLSRRYTYRHSLGRMPTEGSAATMQWGDGKGGHAYRMLHADAWREARRILRPGALAIINSKNHIRGGVEQLVTEWHVAELGRQGFKVQAVKEIPAKGIKHGANAGARVDNERLIVARAA